MNSQRHGFKGEKTLKSLAFLSQKGGSGKTTISIHIAIAACDAGEKVLLFDTDPQGSASAWAQVRKTEYPTVKKATAGPPLSHLLDRAKAENYSLVIFDTPPHTTAGVDIIAKLADFLIIPCRPSVLDLVAIASSVNIARASDKPAAFVLNSCNPRVAETGQSRKALERHPYPVAPVEIGSRQAYSRALTNGSTVVEFEPHGKAAKEISELWCWIKEQLDGRQ
jgi:chromosome partitioning protein